MLRTLGSISIIVFFVFLACHKPKEQKERVDNIINRSYLRSGSFKAFQRQTYAEAKQSIRHEHAFRHFVQKGLANENIKVLRAPAVIDKDLIEKALKAERDDPPRITAAFGRNQLYHPLATVQTNDFNYHFFLMCKVTSYDDCLIWLATANKSKLIGLQMISLYNRALAYQEIPVLYVKARRITVDVKRSIKYPIAMQSSYKLNYQIISNGKIYRINKP